LELIKTYKKWSAAQRFMQSVQLPDVGILLAIKRNNSDGVDVGLKPFVKYKTMESSTKT